MSLNSFPFPITLPKDAPIEAIEKSTLITSWYQRLEGRVRVSEMKILSVDLFGKRVGFIEVEVTYRMLTTSGMGMIQLTDAKTERFVLSGKSCMIVPLLYSTDTKEIFTVLVHQPRVGSGRIMYEFPAGMTEETSDYKETASRELREEVGIDVSADDLIPLSEKFNPKEPVFYLNYKRFDQKAKFYLSVTKLRKSEIMEFEGKKRGADADEQISLHVVPFDQSWLLGNEPATLAAIYMINTLIESKELSFE